MPRIIYKQIQDENTEEKESKQRFVTKFPVCEIGAPRGEKNIATFGKKIVQNFPKLKNTIQPQI